MDVRLPVEDRLLRGYPVGVPRINEEAAEEIKRLRKLVGKILEFNPNPVVYLVKGKEIHGDSSYIAAVFSDKEEAVKFAANHDIVYAGEMRAYVEQETLDLCVGSKVVKKETDEDPPCTYYEFDYEEAV